MICAILELWPLLITGFKWPQCSKLLYIKHHLNILVHRGRVTGLSHHAVQTVNCGQRELNPDCLAFGTITVTQPQSYVHLLTRANCSHLKKKCMDLATFKRFKKT